MLNKKWLSLLLVLSACVIGSIKSMDQKSLPKTNAVTGREWIVVLTAEKAAENIAKYDRECEAIENAGRVERAKDFLWLALSLNGVSATGVDKSPLVRPQARKPISEKFYPIDNIDS